MSAFHPLRTSSGVLVSASSGLFISYARNIGIDTLMDLVMDGAGGLFAGLTLTHWGGGRD